MSEQAFSALSPERALCELIGLAIRKGALRRVTLSKCADAQCKRATLTLRIIGQQPMLQQESFTYDNKAYHQNISPDDTDGLSRVLSSYGQINVLTAVGDCELKCAKGGRKTLLRGHKLWQALNDTASAEPHIERNDRKKQYILRGQEPFLQALGVSDERGRVHDKKQPKFRQINRFLELLRDVEEHLPSEGTLRVCDLCCGKSYLSFAAARVIFPLPFITI